MAIRMTITTDGDPGSEYVRSFLQERIVIGRSRSADVCLPTMAVSTRHAEIKIVGGDFAIVDLDSLNGTEVNDRKVLPFRNRVLKDGDIIRIADFTILFQTGVVAAGTESRDLAVQQAREMLTNVLARSGESFDTKSLHVLTGPSRGTRVELKKEVRKLVIGRGKGVDFFLDDPDVSRQHAELVIEAAGVFIRDLRSRNGVIVNDKKVDAVKLALGDQFTLGGSTITLEHPAEKTLGLIFEAPEEDTSSFVLFKSRQSSSGRSSAPSVPAPPPEEAGADRTPSPQTTETPSSPPSPPPPIIGPKDPLLATPGDERTTGKHPLPSGKPFDGDSKGRPITDIGLILVGAVILAAAVGALIYLFQ